MFLVRKNPELWTLTTFFQENLLGFIDQHDRHLHFLGQNCYFKPWTFKDNTGVQMMPSSSPKHLQLSGRLSQNLCQTSEQELRTKTWSTWTTHRRPCSQIVQHGMTQAHQPGFPNKAKWNDKLSVTLQEDGKTLILNPMSKPAKYIPTWPPF